MNSYIVILHGLNHGVRALEFGMETLMQIVPQILSCFKISRIRCMHYICNAEKGNAYASCDDDWRLHIIRFR